MLKIIAGKILTQQSVLSNGKHVFYDGDVGITYLGMYLHIKKGMGKQSDCKKRCLCITDTKDVGRRKAC